MGMLEALNVTYLIPPLVTHSFNNKKYRQIDSYEKNDTKSAKEITTDIKTYFSLTKVRLLIF